MNTPAGGFEVAYTTTFWDSLHHLAPADQQRCTRALQRFSRDPNNPGLRFGPLSAASGDRWKIRAAQQLRIILERKGNIYFVLLAGQRQDVYERSSRLRSVLNRGAGRYVYVEQQPAPAKPTTPERQRQKTNGLGVFSHWTDRDLVDTGLTDEQVLDLRRCNSEDDLLDLATGGWADDDVEIVIDLLGQTPEEWRAPAMILEHEIEETRIRAALSEFGAIHGISRLFSPSELERLAAAPIEDWMVFLHPDQGSVAAADYGGPARVRGPVGTGKTVVALHRAAELAKRYPGERILFTTFVKSLPPVFENLYQRLPDARAGQVDFVNIDRLARRIYDAGGAGSMPVEPEKVNASWAKACRSIIRPGTPLASMRLSRPYLREEVERVIKGMALSDCRAYLSLDRRGRRTALNTAAREQIWELRESWDREMAVRETIDFPDVLLRAIGLAKTAEPVYRIAIIDESQDLTLAGLRLVQHLTPDLGEAPDGVFLVGDAAQRIYAGGFTLAQAGIEIRGRSSVLRDNYRNTAEILETALEVCGSRSIQDLDEEYERATDAIAAARSGPRPASIAVRDRIQQYDYIAETIAALTSGHSAVGIGDIAVFSPTNSLANTATKELESREVPVTSLRQYKGSTAPAVKIGTFHRAKGLEFKAVFLTDLDERFPRAQKPSAPSSEYEDYLDLAVASLFVAMTRARDLLYLVSPGGHCALLESAEGSIDAISLK